MTIEEIADLITTKKYVFQVSIPGTNFSHGKTTVESALSVCDSLENYFERILLRNKTAQLNVSLYAINGNSYSLKRNESVFLPKTLAVVDTEIDKSISGIENNSISAISAKPTPNIAIEQSIVEQKQTPSPTKNPMENKDYIEFKVLEIRYDTVLKENKVFEAKVNKLEKKVEDLHDENKQLLRDNSTKEDKHEIALERVKMAMEKESKDSLSGVVDFANNNPETVKMLLGAFFPNNPNFKQSASEQPALEGATDNNREIKYTEDSQANSLLNDIPRILSQKDGQTMVDIYLLFQEFIAKPETLEQAITTFIPHTRN